MNQFKFAGLGDNPNYFHQANPLGSSGSDWNQDGVPDHDQPPPTNFPTDATWPPPSNWVPGEVPPPTAPVVMAAPNQWKLSIPIISELPPIMQLAILATGGFFVWRWWASRKETCEMI